MLLSKGLCSNTYQQMQPIPASAIQNSVSLLHAPAGADERRKVPLLVHVGQTQTSMSSSVGYASQLTRTRLNIRCLVHAPLPAGVAGTAWQTCPASSQHARGSAPRKLEPWDHLGRHPREEGLSLPLGTGTAGGREFPGCKGFASRLLGGTHWNGSRWDTSFPTSVIDTGFTKSTKPASRSQERSSLRWPRG